MWPIAKEAKIQLRCQKKVEDAATRGESKHQHREVIALNGKRLRQNESTHMRSKKQNPPKAGLSRRLPQLWVRALQWKNVVNRHYMYCGGARVAVGQSPSGKGGNEMRRPAQDGIPMVVRRTALPEGRSQCQSVTESVGHHLRQLPIVRSLKQSLRLGP